MKKLQIGWGFWFQWMILMAFFFFLSYAGIDFVERPIITRMVSVPWAQEAWMLMGLALLAGFAGIGQWLLLRPYLYQASWWAFAFAITYWVGTSLTEIASATGMDILPSFVLVFLLLGPVCGFWQYTILRNQVDRASWWIFTTIISWLVLFGVSVLVSFSAASIFGGIMDDYLPLSYALGGAAWGAITGAVLMRLMRETAAKKGKRTAMAT